MERFDLFAQRNGVGVHEEDDEEEVIPTTESVNGHDELNNGTAATPGPEFSPPPPSSYSSKRNAESDFSRDSASKTPPAKKRKPEYDVDADAIYAARLQAEENKRARPTRGSSTRKAAPAKKKSAKSKTTRKIKAEDDSDLESASENGTTKEVNRSGGFHVSFRPCCRSVSLLYWSRMSSY
jgi:upstream activation factor subunit UAF30